MDSGSNKDSVQVCIRTRPTSNFATDLIKIDQENKGISIHLPRGVASTVNNQQQDWSFKFDNIIHNGSQELVYDTVGRDLVEGVLNGYSATLLAYGQTGSGKTFTMCGSTNTYAFRGMIPRSLSHIFSSLSSSPSKDCIVRVSYLEIYNEQFVDLLYNDNNHATDSSSSTTASTSSNNRPELVIRDDENGNVLVKGLTKKIVSNEEDALNALFTGDQQRATAIHALNKHSSRSHTVFTVYLEMRSRVESTEKVVFSKLNLVDLAGSERLGKTESTHSSIVSEAKYINRSLSFLEQVIISLSSKQREHIPFRQSKLTNLLRDSIGGHVRTKLIATLWCEKTHIEESLATLRFAQRMKHVNNVPQLQFVVDPQVLIKKQDVEIKNLKAELAMHDVLSGRVGVSYDPYTPEEQVILRAELWKYVQGQISDVEIVNLRQIKECFRQFKNMILDAQLAHSGNNTNTNTHALMNNHQNNHHTNIGSSTSPPMNDMNSTTSSSSEVEYVGDIDDTSTSSGYSVGRVHNSSKPPQRADSRDSPLRPKNIRKEMARKLGVHVNNISNNGLPINNNNTNTNTNMNNVNGEEKKSMSMSNPDKEKEFKEATVETSTRFNNTNTNNNRPSSTTTFSTTTRPRSQPISTTGGGGSGARLPSERSQISEFRNSDGNELYMDYLTQKSTLKQLKKQLTDISIQVNRAKQSIDQISHKLNGKRFNRHHHHQNNINNASSGMNTKDEDVEVIDEEEYGYMRDLKNAKTTYQELYARRTNINEQVVDQQVVVADCNNAMARAFIQWQSEKYGIINNNNTNNNDGGDNNTTNNNYAYGFDDRDDENRVHRNSNNNNNRNNDDDNDILDDGEEFDRLEAARVMSENPQSMSFFNARKKINMQTRKKKQANMIATNKINNTTNNNNNTTITQNRLPKLQQSK